MLAIMRETRPSLLRTNNWMQKVDMVATANTIANHV